MFVPMLLIVLGVVSLLDAVGIIYANWSVVWSVVLIVIGFSMFDRRGKMCFCGSCKDCKECKNCKIPHTH